MARCSTSSRMPSSLRKFRKSLPRWILLFIILQILFSPAFRQFQFILRRLLLLFDEAVQQNNLFINHDEQCSRNPVRQSRTDFPDSVAEIIHEGLPTGHAYCTDRMSVPTALRSSLGNALS